MKKLLFTLAVAGAMAVGADEIASANVVGYQTGAGVNVGFTTIGACFSNVGEDALALSKLSAQGEEADGELQLWVVDKSLSSTQKAYWFNEYYDEESNVTLPAGWFDKSGVDEIRVDLAKGCGVLLKTGDAGVSSSQMGEVAADNVPDIPVNVGFTVLANPYCLDLPISNIAITGEDADNELQLWVVDKSLSSTQKAYWFNEYYDAENDETLPAGWFDKSGLTEQTYNISAGSAVLLKTGDAGVKATLKSPVTL